MEDSKETIDWLNWFACLNRVKCLKKLVAEVVRHLTLSNSNQILDNDHLCLILLFLFSHSFFLLYFLLSHFLFLYSFLLPLRTISSFSAPFLIAFTFSAKNHIYTYSVGLKTCLFWTKKDLSFNSKISFPG